MSKRAREIGRADMAEAREWQAMGTSEREWYTCLYLGDWVHARESLVTGDHESRHATDGEPLRVPLGHVTRMRTTDLGSAAARAIFGAILATLLVACTPPPAWMPGDPPLAIWADTDATWADVQGGCARWSMTGLTCERVWDRYEATVEATTRDLDGDGHGNGENGQSHARFQTSRDMEPEWGRFLALDVAVTGTADGPVVAAHELGHLLGIWEHVDHRAAPWALMRGRGTLIGSGAVVSDADLTALEAAWGVPRGEW